MENIPAAPRGIETGDLSTFASTAGTVTADSAIKRTGAYSLKIVGTGSNQNWVKLMSEDINGTPTASFAAGEIFLTAYLRIATAPSSGAENIVVFRGASNENLLSLRLTSSRTLAIYDMAGSLLATGATALALDDWHRIDLRLDSQGLGRYTLLANGVGELTGSIDTDFIQIDHLCLGNPYSSGSTAFTIYFDDIVPDYYWFPGDVAILRAAPNADGSDTAWANDYTYVDEVPPDTTTYVSSTVAGQKESVNLQSCADIGVPSAAVLMAVTYFARVIRIGTGGAGNPKWAFYSIVDGESDLKPTDFGLAATTSYVTRLRTRSALDVLWTTALIDSMQVGVVDKRDSETATLRCTQMMTEILYRTDIPGQADLAGAGYAELEPSVTVPAAATLTGAGSASCDAMVMVAGAAVLTGAGSASCEAIADAIAGATLTGAGTAECAALVTEAIEGAGTMTGFGAASCEATSNAVGAATLTGIGTATCILAQIFLDVMARHSASRSCAWVHAAIRLTPVAHTRTSDGRKN